MHNKRQNDCQVLLVSDYQETYRSTNDVLKSLGLTAMWVQDLESARMLAKTADVKILLCDPAFRSADKLFSARVMQAGSICIGMDLPKPDPNGTQFDSNIDLSSRLHRLIQNLLAVNTKPTVRFATISGF